MPKTPEDRKDLAKSTKLNLGPGVIVAPAVHQLGVVHVWVGLKDWPN